MSEIKKDEAVILDKLDYGNTSVIAHVFSRERGRFSIIVKGGKNPKSKYGLLVDPLNIIETVLYVKENRDLQLLTNASLVSSFPKIKEDLDKLKNCYAVLELVKKLIPEHEENPKLYRGIKKILDLFETSSEEPDILFGRFFIFFITLLGYEIQLENCAGCGAETFEGRTVGYSYNSGIICNDCRNNFLISYDFSTELFDYLRCLKVGREIKYADKNLVKNAITFMENFLKFHIGDFKGIKSLQIFKEI